MGVYIKGMKMPENCLNCDLFYYKDTRETDLSFPRWPCGPWECYNVCAFQGHKKVDIRFRPDGCPLVEIQPHGRLIDTDAVSLDGGPYEYDEWCKWALDQYQAAPTIIPAEEGE